MGSKEITMTVSPPRMDRQFLKVVDRALYAAGPGAGKKMAQATLEEVNSALQGMLEQLDGLHPQSFAAGSVSALRDMLIRIVHRKEGDRVRSFLSRKHVPSILQAIALAENGAAPSDIARKVGVGESALTTLLKDAEQFGLIESGRDEDARFRRRVLTPFGRSELTSIRPTWSVTQPECTSESESRTIELEAENEKLRLHVMFSPPSYTPSKMATRGTRARNERTSVRAPNGADLGDEVIAALRSNR
jgi:DNA-binding MarR family transcriptional regulator